MRVKLSQYAKMTGVSVRTLWRRIKEGSLPIVRSETGRVFVELDEVKPHELKVCVVAEELVKKIEIILNVENGKWNNVEKIYQFQFVEKFDIEYIYLSEKAMLHIAAQHCT